MILHLAYDEKVVNRCIDNFNYVYPGGNKYIILTYNGEPGKFVTRDNVTFCKYNSRLFWNSVGDVSQYSSIVLHLLLGETADFILKVNHPNVYWIEWGGDLYNQLLEVRGYKLYYNLDISWKMSHVRLPRKLYFLAKKLSTHLRAKKILKAAKKVRFFVPDSMYDEIEILKQYYPELLHLRYKNFFYYPIDEVVQSDLFYSRCHGANIMIGNSASTSGNHELVFDILKDINIEDRTIICPLSYGNTKYADYIEGIGHNIWGDRFNGIRTFMPLEKYNNVLMSANTFIFGNWRQEAVGNILVSLFIGGKVFLDIRNPLYSFYLRNGLTIFPLNTLTSESISQPLDDSIVERNREILMQMYSKEKLYSLIRENFAC